jgi:peptidoglycan/LPS O-acetylase OafA/YrhL
MTEKVQVLMLQIVGTIVAGGIVLGAAFMASKGYAVPAVVVSSLVSALTAKLFGEPLQAVTLNQVSKMEPPMAAAVAMRAIDSLPPQHREQLGAVQVVLKGLSEPPPPPPEAAP